jgi:hypothetical protein
VFVAFLKTHATFAFRQSAGRSPESKDFWKMLHFTSVNDDRSEVTPRPPYHSAHVRQDVRNGLIGVGMINHGEVTGGSLSLYNISMFLNRLLGKKEQVQNALLEYFNDILAAGSESDRVMCLNMIRILVQR